MEESTRYFFAIRIPDEAVVDLQLAQKHLPKEGVRYTLTKDFHLTFKFLGELPLSKRLEAQLAVKGLFKTLSFTPDDLELKFTRIGTFEQNGEPMVVWVGVHLSPVLYRLQKDLDFTLEPLGFIPEKQSFKPHITLARIREIGTGYAPQVIGVKHRSFRVDSFDLMESHLRPHQPPEYRVVESYALA